jgi:hypothetical protein
MLNISSQDCTSVLAVARLPKELAGVVLDITTGLQLQPRTHDNCATPMRSRHCCDALDGYIPTSLLRIGSAPSADLTLLFVSIWSSKVLPIPAA